MSLHLGKVLLSEAGKAAPVEPGIYFICLDQAVKYDSGVTPVVYIGSSQNLRDRLRNHKRNSHNQSLILLQELYQGLIYCDLFKFSVEERDTLYAVEESALQPVE